MRRWLLPRNESRADFTVIDANGGSRGTHRATRGGGRTPSRGPERFSFLAVFAWCMEELEREVTRNLWHKHVEAQREAPRGRRLRGRRLRAKLRASPMGNRRPRRARGKAPPGPRRLPRVLPR